MTRAKRTGTGCLSNLHWRLPNHDRKIIIMIGIMVIFFVVVTLINPKFVRITNLFNILQSVSVMGILAVGMTFVLITSGIDLAAGHNVTLSAVTAGAVFMDTGNAYYAMLAGFGLSLLVGLFNGLVISRIKIMPFITSLASMAIVQGLIQLIGSGKLMQLRHLVFDFIGKRKVGSWSISTIIMLLVVGLGYIVLHHSKLGSYTYAIGSNKKNAEVAGVDVNRYILIVYALSGACAGLSGILLGSRVTLVTLNSGGSSLLMDTIAAVILGGVSTSGGEGKMTGTLIGIIFMGMISNALTLLNVPSVSQDLFKGLVIISALSLNAITSRNKIKRI